MQEIGQAFKTWENTELQMNTAGDPPSSDVSFYLEKSTVYFKEQILRQLSLSSGPTAYSTCSSGCSNLTGQPQIKHGVSGQPGLRLLSLFCQLFKNCFPCLKLCKRTSGLRVIGAVTAVSALSPAKCSTKDLCPTAFELCYSINRSYKLFFKKITFVLFCCISFTFKI